MTGFDWQRVMVEPWAVDSAISGWIVLMGFLVTAGCGLVGNYLLLRRMALVGDAISHSILPGLIVAFLVFKQASLWVAVGGAFGAGLLTIFLIEFIHHQSRVKPDAAICITFTTLFAIGVVLMSLLEGKGNFHIDADCVLYGEIAFVPLEPLVVWLGHEIAPPSVLRMGLILLMVGGFIIVCYKELLLTSFDGGLAQSLGINPRRWHYALMVALILVIVGAFEAVGAILAVAMFIVPSMFAAQLSERLPVRLLLTLLCAVISSLLGFHVSVWLNCSTAGAMVSVSALLFVLVWWGGMIRKKFRLAAG